MVSKLSVTSCIKTVKEIEILNYFNMLIEGTKIELESGMQYEIVKCHNDEIYDLKALTIQFEFMPDYFPIYYSIRLEKYKILNKKEMDKIKKLNVCPICWHPLENGIVNNMCVNENCPTNKDNFL